MQFNENELYHVYNRGNQRQPTFFNDENYIQFLHKVRKYILPHCEILSYCLMPNHFHFLIYADERTGKTKKIGIHESNVLSNGFKSLLSSYAQSVNKQIGGSGSIFTQNTKTKALKEGTTNYAPVCFHYIHQNPLNAKLTTKMEDWRFSSFKDFIGKRKGTLCNKQLAYDLLDLNQETIYSDAYKVIPDEMLSKIFDIPRHRGTVSSFKR